MLSLHDNTNNKLLPFRHKSIKILNVSIVLASFVRNAALGQISYLTRMSILIGTLGFLSALLRVVSVD